MTALDTIKYAILGVPTDPNKKPSRIGVVQAFSEMQLQLEAAQAGALVFSTTAQLPSGAVPSANIMAWVMTGADAGIYRNTGTTLAAVWTRISDIPVFFIVGINAGEGTANAIQVTTDLPVPVQDGRAMIGVQILAENTISPPTVSINNEAPREIVSASGNNIAAGGLKPGFVVGFKSAGKFQLISDQASAALLAQVEAAKQAAENAAASVVQKDFPSVAAASGSTISIEATHVRTAGYSFAGDGGNAVYKRSAVEPSHEGKFQSSDGAWWELAVSRANVMMFGADPTGQVSSVAAFGAAARYGDARVVTIDAYKNMPQPPTIEVDIPNGIYKLDWWIDTANREVTWNIDENVIILNDNDERNSQLLEGRQVRKNRVTRPFPNLTLDNAAAFSVSVGGAGDVSAPVNGWTDPNEVGSYSTMDCVGFAVQNNSVPLLAAKSAMYSATGAVFAEPLSEDVLRRIRIGEYVEAGSGNGYSGTHRGQVISWADDGTSIEVTGWFPIENGPAQPGEIPNDDQPVLFRCFHKLFTLNGIGVLNSDGYATEVAGFENSVLNFKVAPTDADVTLGRSWGSDAVNLNQSVPASSLHVSRGHAFEGFRAVGQQVGFSCRGGYNYSDAPVGFEYRGPGVGIVAKNAADQVVLKSTSGTLELGNEQVAGVFLIDSHTSGSVNRDYDARILFSGGDGATDGTGNIELIAAVTKTNSLRPRADNMFNLGDAGERWANIYAANPTIQTSDGNVKELRNDDGAFTDAEYRAIARISPKWYQFKDAINEKGAENAREHLGYIAQDWADAWEAEGLDWRRCGAICEDEIFETIEIEEEQLVPEIEEYEAIVEDVDEYEGIHIHRGRNKRVTRRRVKTEMRELLNEDGSPHLSLQPVLDENGKEIIDENDKTGFKRSLQPTKVIHTVLRKKIVTRTERRATGKFRMGLRYDECAAMIAAYQTKRISELEQRLMKLEQKK